MKKQSAFKMKGPGQKSPAKAIGGGKYIEGFKKMTTKKLFDVVKRNDRGLESGRKEIVKRTKERGDANAIYQAMTANDSTNTAKRVIRNRIKKGTFDDGSLKPGENPFKMKGFSGFGNSPLNDTVKKYEATKEADYKKHRGIIKEKYAAEDRKDPLTTNIMKTRSEKMRGSKRFQDYRAIGPR